MNQKSLEFPTPNKVLNILCVEDNNGDMEILREMLVDTGLEIGTLIHVETLSQAREKFIPDIFDVIFLDLSLPDAQGLETMEKTKLFAREVSIVVMTGLNSNDVGIQCIRQGAEDYLVKGHCDGALLKRVLRYVMERKCTAEMTRITQLLQVDLNKHEVVEAKLTEALKQLEGQTEALNQLAIVAETDAAGHITYVNDQFCKISKYSREELLGKDHRDVVNSGYHPKSFWQEMWSTISRGQTWQGEVKNRAKDGTLYWVDTSIVPFPGPDGKPYKYLAIRAVITTRKEAEAALNQARDAAIQSVRVKSEFMANMSHEIRTPMNSIIGMAELLSETALTPVQKNYVNVFRRSGEHLLTVINDILDLSTVESGILQLEKIGFNLTEVVEDTINLQAESAREKGITLEYSIAPKTPNSLSGDPVRLNQVITNIIGNAIKFTESGKILVEIQSDVKADQKIPCRLQFTVTDTGIGIAADKIEAVFESFVQADSSITRKYGGTGLGLTISKKLVEMMGGRIWVTSKENVGTRIVFEIPYDIFTAPLLIKAADSPCRSLNGVKAIIVDDDPSDRFLETQLLTIQGLSAVEYNNAALGIKEIRRARDAGNPYELLLVHLHMPGSDGFDMVESLRKDKINIGIILMSSATANERDLERCKTLGVIRPLLKPVKTEKLIETIRAVLNSSNPINEKENLATGGMGERDLSILLVEDSPDNQMLVLTYLRNSGHAVDVAINGEIAVQKATHGSYDLILMDMQMPVMDGYTATQEIRLWETRQNKLTKIPIIALTAYALKEEIEKSMTAGCTSHMTKPIKRAILMKEIRQYAN